MYCLMRRYTYIERERDNACTCVYHDAASRSGSTRAGTDPPERLRRPSPAFCSTSSNLRAPWMKARPACKIPRLV